MTRQELNDRPLTIPTAYMETLLVVLLFQATLFAGILILLPLAWRSP